MIGLKKHRIPFERTSFEISPDLKKSRDLDWTEYLIERQILDIIISKTKKSKLKLKGYSHYGLPVEVGSVSMFDENVIYRKAITGEFDHREVINQEDEKEYCLKNFQPIILIASDSIPESILTNRQIGLKTKAKEYKKGSTLKKYILYLILFIILLFLIC